MYFGILTSSSLITESDILKSSGSKAITENLRIELTTAADIFLGFH